MNCGCGPYYDCAEHDTDPVRSRDGWKRRALAAEAAHTADRAALVAPLAAAERLAASCSAQANAYCERAEVAEARVRELEAALAEARCKFTACEVARLEARVRELEAAR